MEKDVFCGRCGEQSFLYILNQPMRIASPLKQTAPATLPMPIYDAAVAAAFQRGDKRYSKEHV